MHSKVRVTPKTIGDLFRVLLLCTFLLSLPLFAAGCLGQKTTQAGAYQVTDAQGTVVTIPARPHRILTLSMGTDEIVLGLRPPSDLAGVNALLEDPANSNVVPLARQVEKKVTFPTAEEVIAMHPDLVIFPDWGDLSMVPTLRDAGLPVVVTKGAKSLAEIEETIRLIAAATDDGDRGERLVSMMEERLATIEAKVSRIPESERKSVVLISIMQNYGGKGSAFDEACNLAGVTNGRAALGILDGQAMTKEDLVKINPDILFLPTYTNNGKFDVNAYRDSYLKDPSLQTLKAIKNGALKEPFEGFVYNNSQDFVLGVQEIAYQVYGDDFKLSRDEHLTAVGE